MTTLAQRRKRPVTLGPADHGRRMSLAMFDSAIVDDGSAGRYELNKGVIEVSDVPSFLHMVVLDQVRRQFMKYQDSHEDIIHFVLGGQDSKVSVAPVESERHPDLSIYMTPPPNLDQPWSIWRPQIVVEVVSPSSVKRDYEEKPPEYLSLGVSENWILDPMRRELLLKSNVRGAWHDKIYKPTAKLVTTPLLPGFAFDLKRALNAAK